MDEKNEVEKKWMKNTRRDKIRRQLVIIDDSQQTTHLMKMPISVINIAHLRTAAVGPLQTSIYTACQRNNKILKGKQNNVIVPTHVLFTNTL